MILDDTRYSNTTKCIIVHYVLNSGVAPWRWQSAAEICKSYWHNEYVFARASLWSDKMNYISLHGMNNVKIKFLYFNTVMQFQSCPIIQTHNTGVHKYSKNLGTT